jgi:hypothetical protein
MFRDNFAQYEPHVDDSVRAAGPAPQEAAA